MCLLFHLYFFSYLVIIHLHNGLNIAPALDLTNLIKHNITITIHCSFFVIFPPGIIRTTQPLDREAAYSYRLIIRAVDGGNPALSSSATVYVNVNDLNDNAPVFSQDRTYQASVREEQPAGEFVAWIIATDTDSGVLGNISYSLIDSKCFSLPMFSTSHGKDYSSPCERHFGF